MSLQPPYEQRNRIADTFETLGNCRGSKRASPCFDTSPDDEPQKRRCFKTDYDQSSTYHSDGAILVGSRSSITCLTETCSSGYRLKKSQESPLAGLQKHSNEEKPIDSASVGEVFNSDQLRFNTISTDIKPSDCVLERNKSSLSLLHDTCFGVIVLEFESSLDVELFNDKTNVKMTAHGDMLRLSILDTGRYAGVLEAPAMCALLQYPYLILKATLSVMETDRKNMERCLTDSDTRQVSRCSLRVVIYGQKSDKHSVGKLLSDGGHYLRHPVREELRGVEYDNPYILLRPGSEMPPLEQLSIISDQRSNETSNVLDESTVSLVMRIFDSETVVIDQLTAEISDRLQTELKEHQRTALAMMQEKELGILESPRFPSLWQVFMDSNGAKRFRNTVTGCLENTPTPFCGGVIADEMGLGKTLSVLSLICWSLDAQAESSSMKTRKVIGTTLVIAPKSTISGWQEQIKRHIKPGRIKCVVFHGTFRAHLPEFEECDIVLTTYETLRSDWSTKKIFYSRKWNRIVLDEAHHIRSSSSQTFEAVCQLQALYRWCLTGTPICNSLTDYGSLLTFIGVKPFSDKKVFKSLISDPVKTKQPESLKRLENLIRATCLRRKKFRNTTELELPAKSEEVRWIDLSPQDEQIYKFFKLKTAKLAVELSLRRLNSGKSGETRDQNVLTLINILRRICDHGEALLPPSSLQIWSERNSDSTKSVQLQNFPSACDMCQTNFEPGSGTGLLCEHIICPDCVATEVLPLSDDGVQCPRCVADMSSIRRTAAVPDSRTSVLPSAKVLALLENLNREQNPSSVDSTSNRGGKSLVFSVWTRMLDLVQYHLQKNKFGTVRIDGSCTLQQRIQAIKQFTEDPACTVMLASIGSAGEGIDLTAANNVHLLEPHWNPMQEAQAIDRVHRIGQQRDVRVVRYLTRNSIETYVQWIQAEKIRLINQTLDSAHLSQAEIDQQRWEKLQEYIGPHSDRTGILTEAY